MFLFSVFLMFALLSATGGSFELDADQRSELQAEIAAELDDGRRALAQTERERAAALAAGRPTVSIDSKRERQAESIEKLQSASGDLSQGRTPAFTDLKTGWRLLDQGIEKASRNPSLLFYKVQTNAYKFSWVLIPLSVPLIWLLFLHRRRYRREFSGYDHFVFVTYSISFMSLLLVLFVLVQRVGLGFEVVTTALLLVPLVHMFLQLRGAYRLSWLSAGWRAIVLAVFAPVPLLLFVLLLLALGIVG